MSTESDETSQRPPAGGRGDDEAIPLTQARGGQDVILVRVEGGREFQHRLAEIGLTPGVRFRVLSRGQPGPFLVSLREGRFMLGQGMVYRMYVRPA